MNEIEQNVDETPVARPMTKRSAKKGSSALLIAGVVAALVIAGGGAYYFDLIPGADKITPAPEGETASNTDPASLVASVNGAQITRGELDKKIEEVLATFPGAQVPGDAAFELQVLDELVNIKLLLAAATAQGVSVTEEEIDTELNSLIETLGGAETFEQQLAQAGLTQDELRTNMRNELTIRRLLDKNTDLELVSVTDEEIAAMYDDAVASAPEGQEIPPLAEVTEAIRAQLVQGKSAEIVNAYIATLRAEAQIDVKL